jgi:putative nucleotidyltransferase with HDIG domain
MAERDSSKAFQSTSRFRTHRVKTGAVGGGRVRKSFIFLGYFAVLVAIMALGGKPLSFRPGEAAPYDIRARVAFRYPDHALTEAARQTAMNTEPGTYLVRRGWTSEVTASLTKIIAAIKQARSDREAAEALRQEGIDQEIVPLFRLKTEKGVEAVDTVLRRVNGLANSIGDGGVMDDLRYAEEQRNGRSFIRVKDGDQTRTVQLGRGMGLSEVRGRLAQATEAALYDFADDVRRIVIGRLMADLIPNLEYSEKETLKNREAAASAIKEIHTQVNKDERLAAKGVVIDTMAFRKIVEEEKAYRASRTWRERLLETGGLAVVVASLLGAGVAIIRRCEPQRRMTFRRWFVLGVLFLIVMSAARVASFYLPRHNVAPIGLCVLPAAMIFSLPTAVTVAVIGSALTAVGVSADLGHMLSMAAAALTGALFIRDVRRRSSILQTGALMGVVWFVVYLAFRLLAGQEDWIPSVGQAAYGLANGLVTGAVIAGVMPFIEFLFAATTNISLLELSDQNHPALRDMLVRAPGTYHHSLIVGNISEAAAREVGADPLLARVVSYYHDIGKMTKPEYFVENQPPGRSPHDGLSPSMSALIIISHVKDGVDLAKEYGLPDAIVDVIRQHHGTTLVEFFYRRAQETGEDKDKNMREWLFHYPGPLPESREAAIVMVADSVEAASRSLSDPSPGHIDNLVGTIIQRRLMEGQFDESGLTFRDLTTIRETIVRVLVSMFHSRPKYPGQKEE